MAKVTFTVLIHQGICFAEPVIASFICSSWSLCRILNMMLKPTRSSKTQKAGFEELSCGFWLALCTFYSLFPLGILTLSEQSHLSHPSGSEWSRAWGMPVWKLRGPALIQALPLI